MAVNTLMNHLKYFALLSTLVLVFPLSSFARDKSLRNMDRRSVNIHDSVRVGSTVLEPGNYKVEWQPSGSHVQVKFLRNGKAVATAPATWKTNDQEVTQDDIMLRKTGGQEVLTEIDFVHQKEALSSEKANHSHSA